MSCNVGAWTDPKPTTEKEQKIADEVNHPYSYIYNTRLALILF